jgi:hypothetical protein
LVAEILTLLTEAFLATDAETVQLITELKDRCSAWLAKHQSKAAQKNLLAVK